MAQKAKAVAKQKPRRDAQAALIERLRKDWTETEKVILRRRSVRLYKKEQVPAFMIKRILEAGRFAPSAGNCQPWKFIVLRDPEIIDEMTREVVETVRKMNRMVDYRRPGREWSRPLVKAFVRLRHNELHPVPFMAMKMISEERLGLWHGAPTVILIFKDIRGVSSPELDCGIAGQNMVIAAHSMGLGTCWVGFGKLAFEYTDKWKKYFNLEYPYTWANSLAIGWPQGEPDGMVERPTHPVDWYEDGKKIVFE